MTVLLLGASGLIGSHCLSLLLSDDRFDKVIAVVRRTINISHPKLVQTIVDFDKLDNNAAEIKADAV
jgi:thioester reductase-like protein